MVKYVASGLLVLAFAMIARTRLTPEAVAAESIAPAQPTKVGVRATAIASRPVEGVVIDLDFSMGDVEWSVPVLGERYLGRLDWRLGLLEERLALSPDQLDQVATWREQVAQRLETAKSSAEANHFATPRELEAFLRPLLDAEQAVALAAFKQEERSEFAGFLTSSQFSRLAQAVGLKNEQQAEIAAAIAGDVEAVTAFRLDDPRPLELFSSNLDKDPQALGIEQLTWEWLGESRGNPKVDSPRNRQFIKEVRARIDSRVASLEGVLTPEQGEVYREYLRKNWTHPFNQLLFPPLDPGR